MFLARPLLTALVKCEQYPRMVESMRRLLFAEDWDEVGGEKENYYT
jgi:hypothetical protein